MDDSFDDQDLRNLLIGVPVGPPAVPFSNFSTNPPLNKMTSAGTAHLPSFEKLRGQENWSLWKFQMEKFLDYDDLWDVTDPSVEINLTVSADNNIKLKQRKAAAKISLMVESHCIVHIRNAKTPCEIWKNLQTAFESSGLSRRLRLLRNLFSTRLENFSDMQSYVGSVLDLAQQVADISTPLEDEFIGIILLNGLTAEYDPLVLALEHSNIKITRDLVKGKLLDVADKKNGEDSSQQSFFVKNKKKEVQCHRCQGYGHFSYQCATPKEGESKSNPTSSDRLGDNTGSDKKPKRWKKKEKKKTLNPSLFSALAFFNNESTDWYIDSGASNQHMSNNKESMTDFKSDSNNAKITTANNQCLMSQGSGVCNVVLKGEVKKTNISDVLYVPNLAVNLLSVSQLVSKNFTVLFDAKGCKIFHAEDFHAEGDVMATASNVNGLYKLDVDRKNNVKVEREPIHTAHVAAGSDMDVWHKRLGHLNFESMKLLRDGMASGVKFNGNRYEKPCEPCILGKQTRLPFRKTGSRASEKLEIVHSDLCGPMPVSSHNGAKYMLTFTDDFTRKTFVHFLKTKDETFNRFVQFKNLAEKQTGLNLKCLRSDNGGEFCNSKFQDYFSSQGIKHQTTVPETPSQNGVSERQNRIILDKVRSMLIDANLTESYWAEAANYAVYLKNRSPTRAVKGTTPEEKWSGKRVDLSHVRIFGCLAYNHIPKSKRNKLQPRSKRMIFVGVHEDTKAYRLIDPDNPKVVQKGLDVIFDESSFFRDSHSQNLDVQRKPKCSSNSGVMEFLTEDPVSRGNIRPVTMADDAAKNDETSEPSVSGHPSSSTEETAKRDGPNISRDSLDSDSEETLEVDSSRNISQDSLELDSTLLRQVIPELFTEDGSSPSHNDSDGNERSARVKTKPKWTEDYVMLQVVSNQNFSSSLNLIPETVHEALSGPDQQLWRKAINVEVKSWKDNNVLDEVNRPRNVKPIKTKWVFSIKRDIEKQARHKARLVAKGYSQRSGIDFEETFSPVVRHATMRLMFALAANLDLEIEHLDVSTAFLYGDLKEEIFIEPPEGFPCSEGKVFRLKKAIYGLKQSARSWNSKADDQLISLGFIRSKYEPCIYFKKVDSKLIIVAVYVDDFFIFHNHTKEAEALRNKLKSAFKLRDLGEASNCLGLQIDRNRKTGEIKLSHKTYISNLLEKYQMSECKTVTTPMSDVKSLINCTALHEERLEKPYQQLIGSLLYLAVTSRPDIVWPVIFLSQFNRKPTSAHWIAAKRILRYLKGTANFSLRYKKSSKDIVGYSDADWANNCSNRKSFSGNVFKFAEGAVSWECRKQVTTALSSTEAEYISLSDASKEAIHLNHLLEELVGRRGPILLCCDNQSAMKLAENPVMHQRTKHIDVRYHFIREHIANGNIKVKFVPSTRMIADALTKPLPRPKLNFCTKEFGLQN